MAEFLDIIRNLDFSVLLDLAAAVIPAYICITFHEICHGCVAYMLGDNTARDMGRLSLNPFRHLDVMGLMFMVIFHFGWAKPVPVNAGNFENPKKGMALTALAGPLSSLLLAVVAMALYGVLFIPFIKNGSDLAMLLLEAIYMTSFMSVTLAVFNILPIPPMDGAKFFLSFLPDKQYFSILRYERFGVILLALITWTNVLSDFLASAYISVFDKLNLIADFIINRMA